MSRTRAALTAALLLVSALAISGCSDDDPVPKQAPSPTSTPTTASTSPTPEALGPEETVRAWVAAQNEALKTGDTTAMAALGATDCRGCENFIDAIDDVFAAGGKFIGGAWRVVDAHVRGKGKSRAVDVAMAMAGGKTITKAGAEPEKYGPEKRVMLFKLVLDGDVFRLKFVGFVE